MISKNRNQTFYHSITLSITIVVLACAETKFQSGSTEKISSARSQGSVPDSSNPANSDPADPQQSGDSTKEQTAGSGISAEEQVKQVDKEIIISKTGNGSVELLTNAPVVELAVSHANQNVKVVNGRGVLQIPANAQVDISWDSKYAQSCAFEAPYQTWQSLKGQEKSAALTKDQSIKINCTDDKGQKNSSEVYLKLLLSSCQGFAVAGSGPTISDGLIKDCNGNYIVAQMYGQCPDNMAAYGIQNGTGTWFACVPLPAADILSTNPSERYIPRQYACADDEVITGGGSFNGKFNDDHWFQCTKINTRRYQLGPRQQAYYYGNGVSGGAGATAVKLSDVPAAIRYGFGRDFQPLNNWSTNSWAGSPSNTYDNATNDGCINYPYGSLSTEKHSKYCKDYYSRQLQYRGLEGDPSAGTPVKMFPDCSEIEGKGTIIGGKCLLNGS